VRRFIGSMMLVLICIPIFAQAETSSRQHLFHIERSKNANIVQYDAQVEPDGTLKKRKPVVVYWIRLAEQGQEKKLSWIQRVFAYGFKAKPDSEAGTVELDMVVDFDRPITVVRDGDRYRATMQIDRSLSYLDRFYVNATRKGWSVKVHYVEAFGEEMETGEPSYEKFFP